MPAKALDLTNHRFGRLVALQRTSRRPGGSYFWLCECDCGTKKEVSVPHLRNGTTKSCGCFQKENMSRVKTIHGARKNGRPHPLYRTLENMKSRCYNKNDRFYPDYGGRGITVCDEWINDYPAFRDYMLALPNCPSNAQVSGAKMNRTIDRIRNNEGYKPGNVRWATPEQQQNNKRSNVLIKVNGESMSFKDAARRYGKASHNAIWKRVYELGWPLRKAFLTP